MTLATSRQPDAGLTLTRRVADAYHLKRVEVFYGRRKDRELHAASGEPTTGAFWLIVGSPKPSPATER